MGIGYYQGELRDLRGNAMQAAAVDVFNAGTSTPATLYSNAAGTISLTASPFPAAAGLLLPGKDTAANIVFYADDTVEYDVRVTDASGVSTFRARLAPGPIPPGTYAGVETPGVVATAVDKSVTAQTKAGSFTASALAAAGLTGSTAASRYVGATAGGAPTTGAHLVGDFVVDQTGKFWVCTVAGTPGTWAQAGGLDTTKVPLTQTQTVGVPLQVFRVQSSDATKGPWVMTVDDALFNVTQDQVGRWGYNNGPGGTKYLDAEPSFGFIIEQDFDEAGYHWVENYTEFYGKTSVAKTVSNKALTSNVATITTSTAHGLSVGQGVKVAIADAAFDGNFTVASTPTSTTFTYARINANVALAASGGSVSTVTYRPIFYGIGRADGSLQRSWMLAGETGFQINHWRDGSPVANFGLTGANFYGGPGLDPVFAVRAATGSSPQFIFYSGAVNRFGILPATFYQTKLQINSNDVVMLQWNNAPYLSVGVDGLSGGFAQAPTMSVKAGLVAAQAFAIARFSAASTGRMLGLYASDLTTHYGGFNKDGYFTTKKVAAPADADLVASEMALWLDDTNGAAKLMVKAKQADGTVRTAALALA